MKGAAASAGAGSKAPAVSLDDPQKINEMYSAVLDHLLTPPQVKEQLMKSQSLEKKLQTVQMHQQLFDGQGTGSGNAGNAWGDRETALLASIQNAKLPDLQSLNRLKIILSSANRECMNGFLEANGVSILLKIIELRLNKRPITELDIAIMYEILSCCKSVMNNSVGMDGFASTTGSIDILTRCLRFDYKLFAIQVLEILSVCCFYSEHCAIQVLHGIRQNAKFYNEVAFASLCQALVDHDIETKAAIMQFVNSLIMGISNTSVRLTLRNDLKCRLFDEKYDQAVQKVDKEIKLLTEVAATATNNSGNLKQKLIRRSLVVMFGTKAYDEKKVDAIMKNNGTDIPGDDENAGQIEVKSNSVSMYVNPSEGTMAGLLHAAKNAEKMESKFLDMVGGKKTKRRWYELDSEHFKWCSGHDKENDYKGLVPITSITDIRNFTTDSYVIASSSHCFEIETTERVYAMGCETEAEKDNWLTALYRARDISIMAKGSYKVQARELAPGDVFKFAEMFRKQGDVYHGISVEEKKDQLEKSGFEMGDINQTASYLLKEALVTGVSGPLLQILHELVLVPAGAEGTWDAIRVGIQTVREKQARSAAEGKEIFSNDSVVDLLQSKVQDSGNTYSQMNKLAVAAIASEQEAAKLKSQIETLNKKMEDLKSNTPSAVINPILAMRMSKNNPKPNGDSASSANIFSAPPPPVPQAPVAEEPQQEVSSVPPPSIPSSLPPTLPASSNLPSVPISGGKYEKYDKMRKMLPEGAVRQKMMVEGFPDSEIDAYFAGEVFSAAPAAPTPAPPAQVDERFAKYDKMRKMLPEGAVRQKMMVDGFTENEIEGFFSGNLPSTAPAAPAPVPVVDERFAKYDKMRKMLPEGAVRQKMQVDGFTSDEIEGFFSGNLPSAAPPAPAPAVVDERFAKYDKMRKMLPEGAVRQKMQVDGFTQQEIDGLFSGGSAPAASAPAPPAVVDERFAKYDKMRKMLPEGAVRQKMGADGFTQGEIDGFFGGSGAAPGGPKPPVAAKPVPKPEVDLPPEGMEVKPKIKPSIKLKGLFWNKLKNIEVKNTLWYKMQEFGMREEDRKMLEEWFAAKAIDTSAGSSGAGGAGSSKPAPPSAPKLLSVLDGKRTQNVLIFIGKIRKTPEEIAQLVIDLDPSVLNHELASTMLDLLPTPEELTAVKEFKDANLLDNASRLIFQFNRIPRLTQRMECHELSLTWEHHADVVSGSMSTLVKSLKEMADAKSNFEKILAMVLAIGNYINGDTARGQAYGVKIDVFSKLVNLKAMLPSQGSLMNYLALIAEQYYPEIVKLSESWVAIWVAADVSFKQLQTDANQLETQINKVNAEFTRLKPGKENPGLDGQMEDLNGPVIKPLHNKLQSFLQVAKPRLQTLKDNMKVLESDLEKCMNTFGESLKALSEEDPSKKFFSTIVEFAKSFQTALDDNLAKRQAHEKAARALAEAEQKLAQTSPMKPAGFQLPPIPAKSPLRSAPPPPPKTDNLFGQFHKSQTASSTDLLAEFKSKLNKQKMADS